MQRIRIKNSEVLKNHSSMRLTNATLILALILLSGCTAMKFVPENEVLYTGYNIKLIPEGRVKAKKRIKELMDQNVSPKPNTSIFGMRPSLWFYYKTSDSKK